MFLAFLEVILSHLWTHFTPEETKFISTSVTTNKVVFMRQMVMQEQVEN